MSDPINTIPNIGGLTSNDISVPALRANRNYVANVYIKARATDAKRVKYIDSIVALIPNTLRLGANCRIYSAHPHDKVLAILHSYAISVVK